MSDLSRLLRHTRPVKGMLWLGFILACLASLANFGLLFLSGWLLAGAAAAGLGGIATQNLFNLFMPAAGVRFFATVRILARYAERLVTHDAALRVVSVLRGWSFEHLIPRSPLLETRHRSGDILARFVGDTDRMGQFPLDALLPFGVAAVCSTISVLIMALFSVPVALLMALTLFLTGAVAPFLAGKPVDRIMQAYAKAADALRADSVETVQALGDIAFCGATERTLKRLEAYQTSLSAGQYRLAAITHAARQGVAFIGMLTAVGVIGLAANALQHHRLSAAELPMLALGCLAAFEQVSGLIPARQALGRAMLSARRVFALCDMPPPVPQPEHTPPLPLTPDLTMQDVTLAYPGSHVPVLHGLSLSVQAGERVGIIGPSGEGKSSLGRLLMRLAEYQRGSVCFGGVDLRALSTQTLSGRVGVLSQTFHLQQGSIRHNLRIACPDADENEMWAALQAAHLDTEIRAMTKGLDTHVGEHGVCLSGGQARRLAVAQIILRRPAWLLLDEPTEGLTPEAGQALIGSLLMALPAATVLCITHRPEPLTFMNRVLRLENGQLHPREIPAHPIP